MYCVTVIDMYMFELNELFNKFLLKYDACLYWIDFTYMYSEGILLFSYLYVLFYKFLLSMMPICI